MQTCTSDFRGLISPPKLFITEIADTFIQWQVHANQHILPQRSSHSKVHVYSNICMRSMCKPIAQLQACTYALNVIFIRFTYYDMIALMHVLYMYIYVKKVPGMLVYFVHLSILNVSLVQWRRVYI